MNDCAGRVSVRVGVCGDGWLVVWFVCYTLSPLGIIIHIYYSKFYEYNFLLLMALKFCISFVFVFFFPFVSLNFVSFFFNFYFCQILTVVVFVLLLKLDFMRL